MNSKESKINSTKDILARKTGELKAVSDNLGGQLKSKEAEINSLKASLDKKSCRISSCLG